MSKENDIGDPGQRLVRVAEAIVEGWTVDWELEGRSYPEGRILLERLRVLQAIVAAARSTGDASSSQANAGVDTLGTWGRLTIRAKLGEGMFGEVYRAYDPLLDREVALKLTRASTDASHTEYSISEARRLARIRHPNVLVVHGVDVLEGRVGIWTDLLQGKTLAEYLALEGTIGAREAALIGIDLSRALAAVHKEGIVHRDLKASNVMRESGGRIVLMDFGSGSDPRAGRTDLREYAYGTPLLMAPEQLRGEAVGPPADIYSLGVLLYNAVSGEYPIAAASLPELMEKHLKQEAIPLRSRRPDLPSDFVQVIDRSVHPDARRRFQTAGEMERELSASIGAGSFARRVEKPSSKSGLRQKLRALGPIAAGLLVAAALLIRNGRDVEKGPDTRATMVGSGSARVPSEGERRTEQAPRAVTATASLYRDRAGTSDLLAGGMRVMPGDDLYLVFESPESVYAYVLNEDEQGNVFVLFPVPGLAPSNPLPPAVRHRLPGQLGERPVDWEVTSAGDREHILVVAARSPLVEIERELTSFPHAMKGRPVVFRQLSEGSASAVRGIGGFSESAATAAPSERRSLAEVARKVSQRPAVPNDPWVWQIDLENPAR